MKKTAFLGLILSFATILGYVESLFPFSFGIPGIKLGLPNAAILLCLYLYGSKEAITVNLARIVICSLLFSNFYAMIYSFFGAVLSFLTMCICKKSKAFSIVGVSVAGGISHNIGQLLLAILITKTPQIGYYFPVLVFGGCITGVLIGVLCKLLMPYIKRVI